MDIKNLKYFDLEHWPDSNLDHHDKLQTRFCLSEEGTGLLMGIFTWKCTTALSSLRPRSWDMLIQIGGQRKQQLVATSCELKMGF